MSASPAEHETKLIFDFYHVAPGAIAALANVCNLGGIHWGDLEEKNKSEALRSYPHDRKGGGFVV